jgi:hypothetical protein
MMKFWLWLERLDRRWIYLAIGLSVIIPLIFPFNSPTTITPPTVSLWNYVDSLAEEGKPIMVITDYAPSTSPELDPMSRAVIRHALERDIPILIYGGIFPQGFGMAQRSEQYVIEEMGHKKSNGDTIVYGEDWVLLPFIPGTIAVIMGMGDDFLATCPEDARGNSTSELEVTRDIRRLADIGLIIDISGSSLPRTWLQYATTRYGVPVGVGTTAVSAAEYYSFLGTGQFVGMMGGMKGASEYEQLNEDLIEVKSRRVASIAMDAQNAVHIFIIIIVILGNISFFVMKKNKARRF